MSNMTGSYLVKHHANHRMPQCHRGRHQYHCRNKMTPHFTVFVVSMLAAATSATGLSSAFVPTKIRSSPSLPWSRDTTPYRSSTHSILHAEREHSSQLYSRLTTLEETNRNNTEVLPSSTTTISTSAAKLWKQKQDSELKNKQKQDNEQTQQQLKAQQTNELHMLKQAQAMGRAAKSEMTSAGGNESNNKSSKAVNGINGNNNTDDDNMENNLSLQRKELEDLNNEVNRQEQKQSPLFSVEPATTAPTSESTIGNSDGPENDNSTPNPTSQRLIKAKKLLEMAQVSPSQRLEMEEGSIFGTNGANNNGLNGVGSEGTLGNSLEGQGSEERSYKMRMADTFDSLDNLVDSKSLLPGGRWVSSSSSVGGDSTSSLSSSSTSQDMQLSQKTSLSSGTNGIDTSSSSPSTLSDISAGKVAEPLVRYDPIAAERLLLGQPGKWLIRNIEIALPFGWWIAGVVVDTVLGNELQNRRNRAEQLNSIIASLGPAIIKAGQALASRPDLLPSEYLDELQKLQDDVPTFSNDIAFRIVEEELKMKFGDIFELVEPEPVAAASIGQVYKARLIKNGQTVAIKIQRPNTEGIVALDLYVLRWWGGVYNAIFRLLGRDIDFQSVMDDFGALLYAEIDYIAEAANARRFTELYAQDVAIADVFVPKIYSELTSRKVLTMEWVDGFRLTDSESLEANNLDKKKLVDTLVQCSLRQIMENGFFHADPHAGNLLATRDGRLCYLDFGMMSYAAAAQRNGFLLAVVHIVNRDWSELVRVYQRLGFIPEGTDLKPIELALEDALPDVLNADISELNFKNVVGKLGDIMYTYPFSLPPFYISIIRCLGVLEGLAIQVDPKARIISAAYPYVANRVLTDDSQEDLREALRRLIFTADGHIRWGRLESLLDEAKESSGFDVVSAIDKLIDYAVSSEGEELLNDIADQIVDEADSLGRDTLVYITEALGALAIRDEQSAAKALQSLAHALQNENKAEKQETDDNSSPTTVISGILGSLSGELRENLPEPTPAMRNAWKIALLLGNRGASSLTSATSGNAATDTANTISKFIPLARKLSSQPRVTRKANEVVARLGERIVSRGLRAAFGLPPPSFETTEAATSGEIH